MPIRWDKVVSQRPHMLAAARGWYDKWIRGEHDGSNGGAKARGKGPISIADETGEAIQLDAYAEPIKLEDVIEVRDATRDVASRLDALEFAGMAQTETLKNMGEQSQALTRHLADLQVEMNAVDQRLQEVRANAESYRTSMDSLEIRVQKLSGELSGITARVNMLLWMVGVGMVAAIVAIVLVVMR